MSIQKTQAAILRKPGGVWELAELDLDPPKANEIVIPAHGRRA